MTKALKTTFVWLRYYFYFNFINKLIIERKNYGYCKRI